MGIGGLAAPSGGDLAAVSESISSAAADMTVLEELLPYHVLFDKCVVSWRGSIFLGM